MALLLQFIRTNIHILDLQKGKCHCQRVSGKLRIMLGIGPLSKILAVNKLPWLIDLLGNESDKSFSLEVLLTLGILEERSHEKVLL